MKILFSVPTGYHLRELLLPLRSLLEADNTIEKVFVITPTARFRRDIFSSFSHKFEFFENPDDLASHATLMRNLTPSIVVTNTVGHDALDYPILKAAADNKIPTLTFIASWDNVWKISRLMAAHKPTYIADHLIVWNTMMKSHLLQIIPKLTANRISVIGAPRLDYFWQTKKIPSKATLYQQLSLTDLAKPLIHFATTELYPMDYVVAAIAEAIETGDIPACYLYASVHPGGDIKRHTKLASFGATVRYSFGRQAQALHPAFAYVPTEPDIYRLISLFMHADALINHSSTTALESLIAGTPVINVKYGQPFDWWRWYRSAVYRDFREHYADLIRDGATYVVTNKQQLITSLKQALANRAAKAQARQTTIKRMITTTDGSASQKVLAKIKDHAKKP